MTIARRVQKDLYVSLWYLIGALVWTDINLLLLIIGPYGTVPGINNAALHGLFIHYVVGLWITPAGYVLIYYFLPARVRAPIYSHKLSLIGFWSLAFFYPFVGIHHYLYSPIADWAETIAIVSSMMLIIPVWTVLQNFFGTMKGHWRRLLPQPARQVPDHGLAHVPRRLLPGLAGGAALAAGAHPLHRLRHLALAPDRVRDVRGVGHRRHRCTCGHGSSAASCGASGSATGASGSSRWASRRWGSVLSAQGLQQGYMLMARAEWVDTVVTMKPFWFVRTLSGLSMDIGISLLVYNFMQTALAPGPGGGAMKIATRLGAGFFCISLAIFVQGLLPIAIPESRETRSDPGGPQRAGRDQVGLVRGDADYTPLEQLGRGVYQREGCWYCHSQYVRPVAGEDQRWGPVAEVGEYAYDRPHLFSTRRIGPDLSRVGLKFADHWHWPTIGSRARWCRTR